jgi:hypothetical protein
VTEPAPSGMNSTAARAHRRAPQDLISLARWRGNRSAARAAIAAVLLASGVAATFELQAAQPRPLSVVSPLPVPQVNGLPPGSAACTPVYRELQFPFNSGARGTPLVSCAFVEEVRKVYSMHAAALSRTGEMTVVSPATGKWQSMNCIATGKYVTCAGDVAILVYLYNRSI